MNAILYRDRIFIPFPTEFTNQVNVSRVSVPLRFPADIF